MCSNAEIIRCNHFSEEGFQHPEVRMFTVILKMRQVGFTDALSAQLFYFEAKFSLIWQEAAERESATVEETDGILEVDVFCQLCRSDGKQLQSRQGWVTLQTHDM